MLKKVTRFKYCCKCTLHSHVNGKLLISHLTLLMLKCISNYLGYLLCLVVQGM